MALTKIRQSNLTQPLDQDLSVPSITSSGNISLADSAKAIFGDGSDLQIYHDSQHSRIVDNGTGNLIIQGTNLDLADTATGDTFLRAVSDGSVEIYYDGNKKFETTNTGISVTGDVVISGDLTVSGNTVTLNTATLDVEDLNITLASGAANNTVANGAGITIDGANVQLTYNSTDDVLDLNSTLTFSAGRDAYLTNALPGIYRAFSTTGSYPFNRYGDLVIQARSSHDRDIVFVTGTTPANRMVIDYNGNVGIGTDAPNALLDLTGVTASSSPALRFTGTGNASSGDVIGEIEFYNSDDTDNTAGIMGKIRAIAGPSGGEGHIQILTDMPAEGSDANTVAIHVHSTGNVGMGTVVPDTQLTLAGDPGDTNLTLLKLKIEDDDFVNGTGYNHRANIEFEMPASEAGTRDYRTAALISGGKDGIADWFTGTTSTNFQGALRFHTRQDDVLTQAMIINADGFVGIGLDNPKQNLAVSTNDNEAVPTLGTESGAFSILKKDSNESGAYGLITGIETSGNIWSQIQRVDGTATAYHLKLQPSGGKVGIATTWDHPITTFDVNGPIAITTTGTGSRFLGFYQNVQGAATNDLKAFIEKNGTNFTIYNDDAGDLQISNAGGTKIRINSSGFVGVGPNHDASATFSILTPGATGGTDTLAYNVINNGNNFDTNALDAYNDTTGYDVVQKASYTLHARGAASGNIETIVSGNSGTTNTIRYVNLGSPQTASPISATSYYAYTGSGNVNSSMAVADNALLHNIYTYNGGGVDTKFTFKANGNLYSDGAYEFGQVRHDIRPTFSVDFDNSEELDSRLSFYRSTEATYYNAKGFIEYASRNQPRFDHDPVTKESLGILIEETRTNKFTNSDDLDGWTSIYSMTYPYEGISPDGKYNAVKLAGDRVSGRKGIQQSISTTANASYTFSVYAKAGELDYMTISTIHGANSYGNAAIFDLANGTSKLFSSGSLPADHDIIYVGDGWYRCIFYFTNGATLDQNVAIIAPSPSYSPSVQVNYRTANYQGDGVSGVFIWGPQLELGDEPTSYIPSNTMFSQRASKATYFDEEGTLRRVLENEPRSGYKFDSNIDEFVETGFIYEQESTNLFTHGGMESSRGLIAATGSTTRTYFYETAPDGSNEAVRIQYNGGGYAYRTASNIIGDSHSVTASYFIKVYSGTPRFGFGGSWGSEYFTIDVSNETITFSTQHGNTVDRNARVVNVGNGWYRVEFGIVSSGASGYTEVQWAGNVAADYAIWGVQFEEYTNTNANNKLLPTSFIYGDSGGSSTTRASDGKISYSNTRNGDVLQVKKKEFLNFYNAREGTFFTHTTSVMDFTDTNNRVDNIYLGPDGLGTTHAVFFGPNSVGASDAAYLYVNRDGTPVVGLTKSLSGSKDNKMAFTYKPDDFAMTNNGISPIESDTGGRMPQNLTHMYIGSRYGSSQFLNGHYKKIAYYNHQLADEELIALTEND